MLKEQENWENKRDEKRKIVKVILNYMKNVKKVMMSVGRDKVEGGRERNNILMYMRVGRNVWDKTNMLRRSEGEEYRSKRVGD